MKTSPNREGTYVLSGIVQGPLPPGPDGESRMVGFAAKSATGGIALSLRVDGAQFSLLADEQARDSFAASPFELEEEVRMVLQRLLDLYPDDLRMGVFSTIRSQVFDAGRVHQCVYAVVYPGNIELQRGSAEMILAPRRRRLSLKAKAGLAAGSVLILAGGVYATSFWVDYGPLVASARAHWRGTEVESLEVDISRLANAVKVEVVDVSNLRSVARLRLVRGDAWAAYQRDEPAPNDAELHRALRTKRYVRANFYDFRGRLVTDKDGQVIAPAVSVNELIESESTGVDLRLPPGVPVRRLVILP